MVEIQNTDTLISAGEDVSHEQEAHSLLVGM